MPAGELGVVFLLGAGMPGTQKITEAVLCGQGVQRAENGTYYIPPNDGSPWIVLDGPELHRLDDIAPVIEYLNRLRELAREHYDKRSHRAANYEDIYYVADQIREVLFGEYGNPLVHAEAQAILARMSRFESQRRKCSLQEAAGSFQGIVECAWEFIQAVVVSLLSRNPRKTDHLRLISEAWRDERVAELHVATLNHDRVIDIFLREGGIPYADGFEETSESADGFRRFRPEVYERAGRVRVLKLHGGVDWCVRSPDIDDPWANEIGILTEPHGLGIEALLLKSMAIQIGTLNKVTNYTVSRHLSELQHRFLHSLDKSNLMVVSGYGFGDMGINARIMNWIYGRRGRRLVVADPHAGNVMNRFQSRWFEWKSAKAAFSVPQGIEDTTWDDVLRVVEA
jgi:hypothetical protein